MARFYRFIYFKVKLKSATLGFWGFGAQGLGVKVANVDQTFSLAYADCRR